MTLGQSVATDIIIENTGTLTANSFTLTAGNCTQSANGTASGTATDLCSQYNIVISSGPTTLYSGKAAGLSGQTVDLVAAGIPAVSPTTTVPIRITATLNSTVGNTYQGLKISQPLTWTFVA